MKTHLVLVLDTIFVFVISFIVACVFFSYATQYPLRIVFSICVSCLCSLFYLMHYKNKSKTHTIKHRQKKEFNDMVEQLNFCTRPEQLSIIEKAIALSGYSTERKKGKLKVLDTDAVVFMKFGFIKVTKADVLKIYNSIIKSERAFILSEDFDKEVMDFADRFNGKIKLVSAIPLFQTLKKLDCLPQNKYSFSQTKQKRTGWKNFIDKRKSKKFALFGLAFLLFSYFSPIKTYYLVFGVIFLCLSLVVRTFGVVQEEKSAYSV